MRKEIQELLAKKDFSEGLLKLDDQSKVKGFFETNGNLKDITDDEIKELGSDLGNLMQNIAKLPEDKLEKIGGGVGDDDFNLYDEFDVEFDNESYDKLYEDEDVFKKQYAFEKQGMSTGKKVGIGAAAVGGIAMAGAGLYKIGKKKGWWGKVK